MDRLHIFLLILTGVVYCSHDWISGSASAVTVRPGDNITLYCDCKTSSGVHIVWYRNCSHENQPTLVLKLNGLAWKKNSDAAGFMNPLPRFHFVKNQSSESYDLQIMNVSDSDEGLYYCGTEQTKVEGKEIITVTQLHRYGNITTRILSNSSDFSSYPAAPVVSWMMMLIAAFTVLSSFLSFILVYHLDQKTADVHQKIFDTRGQTRGNQDEDLCLTRVVFRAQDGQTHQ